jgi:CheY-like chemotaxis protein/two-component sensor histidine kinase
MELYLEQYDVAHVVQDVATTVTPLVQKNGNQFEVELADDVDSGFADVTKVRQTLINMLSNAAKFTEGGKVTLRVERADENGRDWLMFRVSDTGIGMTGEQMDAVFTEFAQADVSTTRKYGGTGLGLTISKRFCQMMGGDITVESVVNEGTTFTVILPVIVEQVDEISVLAAPDIPATLRPLDSTGEAGIVLVIDDDPTVRELVARSLAREGFRVEVAENGEQGLAMARDLRPDAITLDVMMPDMDGWSVLSALKSDDALADIPVVMITIVDNKNRGFALGAAGYLTKPIDRRLLVDMISRYKRSDGVDATGQVLIVEDDPDTRDVLARTLERNGWTIEEAENGLEGLDRLREGIPDLILLDLMMPQMDGFEFIAEVQKVASWRGIPIVVVTAKELTETDRAYLTGAVEAVLGKHAYDRDRLLQEISQIVNSHIENSGDQD